MTTFLSQVTEDILRNYKPSEFDNLLIIVPSKRVGLHLKKDLAGKLKKAFLSPQIKTIDEFITELHPLGKINHIAVHFELYKAYTQVYGEEETFDSFQSWSSQLLNDFNEIDRYLLNHQEVFNNLKDIKEIEQWSFNSADLSENQEKFLIFWEKLGKLYSLFSENLAQQKKVTPGKMYRDIALTPQQYLNDLPYKKIYIIGFNALSKSEETIIKHLYQTSQAKLFWDTDDYFLQNKNYEAGHFIRQYQWAYESIKQTNNNNLQSVPKKITIYPARSAVDQVNIAAKIIEENNEFSHSKSALILNDESLLNPLINSIPEGVENMNITMGYSIQYTVAKELLDICLDISVNSRRFKQSNGLYFKDLDKLLGNSLFKHFCEDYEQEIQKFIADIIQYNIPFITFSRVKNYLEDFASELQFLFINAEEDIYNYLINLLEFIENVRGKLLDNPTMMIEIEALFIVEKNLRKVAELLQQYPYIKTITGLKKLIKRVISTEKLSFYGEPLNGLQIMGMLETRAIDFENIILLSCNESFLPGTAFSNSFIPFDLKRFLQLPSKYEKDAIFAYYFYRLLQRAKNIHLVYNSGTASGIENNEISRYLIQIEEELKQYKNIEVNTKQFNYRSERKPIVKEMKKSSLIYDKLDAFFDQGMSPSAMNNYLACSMDFYYKYLLRIKEQNEVEESIESSTQGTITHEVLENLYEKYGPVIDAKAVDKMLATYEAETQKRFEHYYPLKNYKKGKNLLTYSMVLSGIKNFLYSEKKFIRDNGAITILELEKQLEYSFTVETPMGPKEVKLKGKADRIDRVGDKIRILDYKTGYVNSNDTKATFWNILTNGKAKANQLMFYAFLYYKKTSDVNLIPGIISMRNLKENVLKLILKDDKKNVIELIPEVFDEYEEVIASVVSEMYSREPFIHNEDARYCLMC